MGELLQNLGLAPRKNPTPAGPTPAGIADGVLPLGALMGAPPSPPMMGTPNDANSAIVTGDAWKPRKASFLGALADAYVQSKGLPGGFVKGRHNRNIKEAMADFTSDPIAAIRRLSMISGEQGRAWDMYNQYTDNERSQGTLDRQNRVFDLQVKKFAWSQAANMMNAAKDPATWPKLRSMALRRGEELGVDLSGIIPEEFDPDSIEFIRVGDIKPKDYVRLQQQERGLDIREEGQESLDRYRGQRLEQIDKAEEGRMIRHNTPRPKAPGKGAAEPRYVKTPRGYMNLSPSGKQGFIDRPDGTREVWIKVAPGKWEKVRTMASPDAVK